MWNNLSFFQNNLAHYDLLQALVEIVSGFGDTLPMIQNNVAAAFARLHPGETFNNKHYKHASRPDLADSAWKYWAMLTI